MHATNVIGTDNVLQLALELRIPRTIHVSSTQAFGDTGPLMRDETFTRQSPCQTFYEQTKTEAHALARQFQERGLPVVIVCPGGVIGANDHSPFGYFLRLYMSGFMPPLNASPNTVKVLAAVEDIAAGIVLAAVKGRLGETYFLTGEPKSLREHFAFWAMAPGGFQVKVWLPARLMATLLWPLEPLQRMIGLPAFLSRETIQAASAHWHFSSQKAQHELGWTFRSAQEMWRSAIEGELELLSKRKRRDLISRLSPLDVDG